MKHYFVKQDGLQDCGVCSLLMILKTYGGGCSKEYLRMITNTTKDGTTAYDLIQAARQFNFTSFGLKGDIELLETEKLPVIAHVIKDKKYHHFVVIYEINKKKETLIIADASIGIIKMTFDEFREISTHNYLIFIQNSKTPKIYPNKLLNDHIRFFLEKNKKPILTIIILSLIFTVLNVISALQIQLLASVINEWNILIKIICFFLLLNIIKTLLNFYRIIITNNFSCNFEFMLFQDIYKRLFILPDTYYENRTSGEIIARIDDLITVKNLVIQFVSNILISILLSIISFIILLKINIILTIFITLISILYFILYFIFKNKIKKMTNVVKEEYAKMYSYLYDSIKNIKTVRHNRGASFIQKNMFKNYQTYILKLKKYYSICNIEYFFKEIIQTEENALLIFLAYILIIRGDLSYTSFITFMSFTVFFLEPFHSFISFINDYEDGKNSLDRIMEVYQVETLREIKESEDKGKIKNLELRNIEYSYRRNAKVIQNISLSINENDKVLIYGSSGSGKSTLIKIIAGYLEASCGEIIINNGENIKNLTSYLRRHITYIGQEDGLLNMSLRDNIVLGREITPTKFQNLASMLELDKIALRHVLAYDMMVEEGGANLSGGEKQRVLLARGLLKEGDIYIFDESLCNMNIEMERRILMGVFKYLQEKIVIVVSHRFYNEDLYTKKIKI